MNDTTAKGTLDKVTGKLKEVVGNLTGDNELEDKGKLEQAKGSAEQGLGHAKDAGHAIGKSVDKAID